MIAFLNQLNLDFGLDADDFGNNNIDRMNCIAELCGKASNKYFKLSQNTIEFIIEYDRLQDLINQG